MDFHLRKNVIFSFGEVIFSGASLFVLYRFVVMEIGLKELGVWSLLLATTSFARLADVGVSAGLSQFVARSMAKDDPRQALVYVESAAVLNLAFFLCLGIVSYPIIYFVLPFVMGEEYLSEARMLLPLAILSFIGLALGGGLMSAISGLQKSYLKSIIVIIGIIVQLIVAYFLVPSNGLLGLALAQVAQWWLIIALGWSLITRHLSADGRISFPRRVDRAVLPELLSLGFRSQAAGFLQQSFDPAVKLVISSVAGLAALGAYELASRMVTQFRLLLVSPMFMLVPMFSHQAELRNGQLPASYAIAVSCSLWLGLPSFLLVALASPLVSQVWVGSVNHLFIVFTCMLCFGYFLSLIAGPAYLLGMAQRTLKWNIVGNLISVGVGASAGLALSAALGAPGTVAGAVIGLALGSIIILVMNPLSHGIRPIPTLGEIAGSLRLVWRKMATR